jgi:hypothetical protein
VRTTKGAGMALARAIASEPAPVLLPIERIVSPSFTT